MADLTWQDIVIAIDTREQRPLDFGSMQTQTVTLDLCDYSVVGLEHSIRIERKSLDDLLQCIGRERQRFDRQVDRMRAYETRAVVCETSWSELEMGQWRSKVTPQQAMGSVLGWIATGVPFCLVGNRTRAAQVVARLAFIAARRRYRECQAFKPISDDNLFEVATSKGQCL